MRKLFSRFLVDESGATAIEYCLIAMGLSIVILTAVNGIGTGSSQVHLAESVTEIIARSDLSRLLGAASVPVRLCRLLRGFLDGTLPRRFR